MCLFQPLLTLVSTVPFFASLSTPDLRASHGLGTLDHLVLPHCGTNLRTPDLKTENFSKSFQAVVVVKRKSGFTKTLLSSLF